MAAPARHLVFISCSLSMATGRPRLTGKSRSAQGGTRPNCKPALAATIPCMQNAIMPNVTIRSLNPETHAVMSQRAAASGQSLQQYLSAQLDALAARPTMAELMDRIERRGGGVVGKPGDTVRLIHEERAAREAHLDRVINRQ